MLCNGNTIPMVKRYFKSIERQTLLTYSDLQAHDDATECRLYRDQGVIPEEFR